MILYIKLFYVFFKVGFFSFGGGYAMLPMMYQEIQAFDLMPAREFSDIVALSQMTPGPIAVNAATYVGYKSSGFLGAVFATIGVSLPSFIIILIIAAFINKFKSSSVIQAVLSGIRPATVGLMASAVVFFSKTSLFNKGFFSVKMFQNPLSYISITSLIIFVFTIIGAIKYKIGPITLTILAGIIGAIIL